MTWRDIAGAVRMRIPLARTASNSVHSQEIVPFITFDRDVGYKVM